MTEIASVPNPKVQAIRDRMGVPSEEVAPDAQTVPDAPLCWEYADGISVTTIILNEVLSALKARSPQSIAELMESTGRGKSTVYKAICILNDLGGVTESEFINENHRRASRFSFKSLPQGLSIVDLASVHHPRTSHSSPGVNDTDGIPRFFTQKPRTVSIEKINGYEQLIADTTRHYGIGELDELITAVHSVCIERIMSATGKCPICQSTLKRNRSAVSCNKCNITLDLGDTKRSLTAFLAMAEQLKGAGE